MARWMPCNLCYLISWRNEDRSFLPFISFGVALCLLLDVRIVNMIKYLPLPYEIKRWLEQRHDNWKPLSITASCPINIGNGAGDDWVASFSFPHLLLHAYTCWIENLVYSHDLQSSNVSCCIAHISWSGIAPRQRSGWAVFTSFTEDLCTIYIIETCYTASCIRAWFW